MWYAQTPSRRLGQMVLDATVVVWTVIWILFGIWIHDLVARLAQPALRINTAGSNFMTTMQQTAASVRDVPVAGGTLERAFLNMSGTGADIAGAGWTFAQRMEPLGLGLGIAASASPILLVVVPWLILRIGFYHRAASAQRFIDDDPDLDLFALLALANQPLSKLTVISHDPVGDWRAGDPAVVRRLASLELRSRGMHLPQQLARTTPSQDR